ncbi:glycosyltransferase family 4 protein [Neptuniibacter sp. QD34_54]|uniref:glycosyltransferase family 4 protein n=1 Tax=Neptuniibacter sp. QD34_54 TaxID=3398208 RepID=UPI0039F554A6
MTYKICHLTSVHTRFDTRIFSKECSSLVSFGYDVSLLVADGLGNEIAQGVSIYDVGKSSSRLKRMLFATNRIYKKAIVQDADVYHIHDPELLPVATKLKKRGKKVLFDSHEDVPKQILSKPYLGEFAKKVISNIFKIYQKQAISKLDGVVAATPFILEALKPFSKKIIDINNFPHVGELTADKCTWNNKENAISFVGSFSEIRGLNEVVNGLALTENPVTLFLGGHSTDNYLNHLKMLNGWGQVNYLGALDRNAVREVFNKSFAGIVTFHPLPNHIDAQPNKMFEYMSAGIPVIASNFPLWKDIIEGNKCGLCVDPLDPAQIAVAIDYLYKNPQEAEKMGVNGMKAVNCKYNWHVEEKKLIRFYRSL